MHSVFDGECNADGHFPVVCNPGPVGDLIGLHELENQKQEACDNSDTYHSNGELNAFVHIFECTDLIVVDSLYGRGGQGRAFQDERILDRHLINDLLVGLQPCISLRAELTPFIGNLSNEIHLELGGVVFGFRLGGGLVFSQECRPPVYYVAAMPGSGLSCEVVPIIDCSEGFSGSIE